jgi:hypothetical protein
MVTEGSNIVRGTSSGRVYASEGTSMAKLQGVLLRGIAVLPVLLLSACAGNMQTQIDPMTRARELAEACGRSVCRTELKPIRLRDLDCGEFEYPTEPFPYADSGNVSLFAGEAILLDFAADGSTVKDPHFVRVIENVDTANVRGYGGPIAAAKADPNERHTMSFEFRQEEGKPDMTLLVRSDLNFTVKFDALIWLPTRNGVQVTRTSMCPVFAGTVGHEIWPQPIIMIAITNFRVIEAGDTVACN